MVSDLKLGREEALSADLCLIARAEALQSSEVADIIIDDPQQGAPMEMDDHPNVHDCEWSHRL